MESLNLNTLASSLPTAHLNGEKELLNNFKAAALSITTLYRSSRQNSKRAYNAGYAAACQDLLTMIQQGVSAGGLDGAGTSQQQRLAEGEGMTIGRVMDWTEARLDAIKSREEEEDEEEEREKERERGRATAAPGATSKSDGHATKATLPTTSASQPKEQVTSLPTPNSPRSQSNGAQLPSEPSSPSPPSHTAATRPTQRPTKSRPSASKPDATTQPPPLGFGFTPASAPPSAVSFPDTAIPIAAGAKRRHAMMMMLDSASPPVSIGGGGSSTSLSSPAGSPSPSLITNHGSGVTSGRRRTRSSRGPSHAQAQNQNFNLIQAASEAMDVEEEGGRERKRVARR